MKKVFKVALCVFATLILIVGILIIENHSKSPIERYTETSLKNVAPEVQTDFGSLVTESNHKVLNNTHTVEYEFLSYEILDEVYIDKQTDYKGEFFFEGELPDPDYHVDYVDYQQMRMDYPDVDEYITSNGNRGMTAAEYQNFLEQHLSEYTSSYHPHTQYVFVKCRITNISNKTVDEDCNCLCIIGIRDFEVVGAGEFNCYFDATQHTEGEERIHHFFCYTFEPGESIECVIGCRLREDFFDFSEDDSYFIGFVPIGLEHVDQFDPSIDDGFVSLDSLQREY